MNDFLQLADLAVHRLGGRVIAANDDFFAPKENLLKESKPIFIEGKYTSRGKWMDGWETRRRRTPGHDWCVIRLGLPGIIRGIVVDTSFFTGNYPERFSLEGCHLGGQHPYKSEKKSLASSKLLWTQIFPETQLKGDSQNLFTVANENRFTHLRLKIFPDGGVARLRVHGEAVPDAKRVSRAEIDLAAVENGGHVVTSSDQFYGAPRNLLMPYAAKDMGDGWETKRRRGPGHDWVVLKLGVPGAIHRIEVNTAHYKGNYPDTCTLEACNAKNLVDATTVDSLAWEELLPKTKLKPNHCHIFKKLASSNIATHARFHIYPDGGVSRLRLFGRAQINANPAASLARFNRLPKKEAVKHLLNCCGSTKWAKKMADERPFPDHTTLFQSATNIWSALPREDWLEAFRHHPAIGAARANVKRSPTAVRWSANEQSAAQTASREALAALLVENNAYAQKFGYVFLICATGKTSLEILQALHQRISNNPDIELRIAAEEQNKITRLRLEKLLAT